MEIYEKIKYLMEEQNITKKDFVDKLLSLEPKLKNTGDIPSVQTIYRYLNNTREIKVELIPYIAEALNVSEQELFNFDIEYATNYNYKQSKEVREIIDLLQYVPKEGLVDLKNKLIQYKELHNKGF